MSVFWEEWPPLRLATQSVGSVVPVGLGTIRESWAVFPDVFQQLDDPCSIPLTLLSQVDLQKLPKMRLGLVRPNRDEPFNQVLPKAHIIATVDALLQHFRLLGCQRGVLERKTGLHGLGLELGIPALGCDLDHLLIALPLRHRVSGL